MAIAVEVETAKPSQLSSHWLATYGDGLYAYAISRVRRPEIAEDLVQETLLAGMKEFAAFSNRSSVKTWLIAILRHKIADHMRVRYRNEKIEDCTLDDDAVFTRRGRWKAAIPRWDTDPHRSIELQELRAVLEGCMSKLPTRMSNLFLARVTDQSTTRQLCAELEITQENVWAILHRTRLRLQQCVTANGFDCKPEK